MAKGYSLQAAVSSDIFVVPAPHSHARSGLRQGYKSLLVQALVTILPHTDSAGTGLTWLKSVGAFSLALSNKNRLLFRGILLVSSQWCKSIICSRKQKGIRL